jgi:chemotaxis protein CheD
MPLSTWVIPPPKKTLVVGVAEMVASNDPGAELLTYSLGSCLGIAVYDPVKKVGGLLHIMLPDSSIDPAKAASLPFMFVDTGVPRLFQAVYNLGGDRRTLVVKVAGGAQFLDPKGVFNIGERNFTALTNLLARHGLSPHAQDVGGVRSRTLRMELGSGNITIKSPGIDSYPL